MASNKGNKISTDLGLFLCTPIELPLPSPASVLNNSNIILLAILDFGGIYLAFKQLTKTGQLARRGRIRRTVSPQQTLQIKKSSMNF